MRTFFVPTNYVSSEALQNVIDDAKEFRFRVDEKEEVLMRINWLERLAKVQQDLSDVQTKEEVEQLKRSISSCQTSPPEGKGRIVETLLENNKWNGLASLDRMIAHLDKAITNEEQQQEEAKTQFSLRMVRFN